MNAQSFEFKTETKQLLDLMINSLYSNREIFLRELVSNASDALDKLRFAAVTDTDLLPDTELAIRIDIDEAARTLTISDNGIGMSRDEVVANIGTIAKSGTREFLSDIEGKTDVASPDLIGQFGVGFYSSFLVADRVSMITRRAGEDAATTWSSDGTGSYQIDDGERDEAGTTVTLHLKAADEEDGLRDFTQRWVVQDVVRKYSDFVSYAIRLHAVAAEPAEAEEPVEASDDSSEGEVAPNKDELPINSMKAIWTRPESEVEDSEYNEFYKHISHDWTEPLLRVATRIEGTFEARGLLFVPSRAPYDIYQREMSRRGLQLYVKRVFILDEFRDLVPNYMRFVKGVVDAEDLPLNISRELLQENRQLKAIKKHIEKKILDALVALKKDDSEKYLAFWKEFGAVMKEGLMSGPGKQDRLYDLLLSSTTMSDDLVPLSAYVEQMKEGQEAIYYITAPSREAALRSPHLEAFRDRGIEVLIMTDRVDELWLGHGNTYQDKRFQSVGQGEVDLDAKREDGDDEAKADEPKTPEDLEPVLTTLEKLLEKQVSKVRASKRLTSSAACLVTPPGGMSMNMEEMMRSSGQSVPTTRRILEINPEHAVTQRLKAIHEANKDDPRLADFAELLHGQAVLAEGGQLSDPTAFVAKVADLMVASV